MLKLSLEDFASQFSMLGRQMFLRIKPGEHLVLGRRSDLCDVVLELPDDQTRNSMILGEVSCTSEFDSFCFTSWCEDIVYTLFPTPKPIPSGRTVLLPSGTLLGFGGCCSIKVFIAHNGSL